MSIQCAFLGTRDLYVLIDSAVSGDSPFEGRAFRDRVSISCALTPEAEVKIALSNLLTGGGVLRSARRRVARPIAVMPGRVNIDFGIHAKAPVKSETKAVVIRKSPV